MGGEVLGGRFTGFDGRSVVVHYWPASTHRLLTSEFTISCSTRITFPISRATRLRARRCTRLVDLRAGTAQFVVWPASGFSLGPPSGAGSRGRVPRRAVGRRLRGRRSRGPLGKIRGRRRWRRGGASGRRDASSCAVGVAAGASGIPQRHARAETGGAGVTGDQPRRGTFAPMGRYNTQ